MAIYHLSTKFVKRSKGQSAVAKAAYNAHDLLKNDNDGKRHDYRYKGGTAFSGIFISKDAPQWAQELAKDREALWSAVEKSETRKNSRLAKEIEVALPHELTDKQREYLVKDFVRENFMRKGLIADVSIHVPSKEGDARNHHAHILLTTREIGKEKFGKKLRDLDTRPQLLEWREKWGHLTNRHLERHGHQERVDHRTLKAQGIDREATIHLGPTATDYERDGVKTELGAVNEEIKNRNQERENLKAEKEKIDYALRKGAFMYDHGGMESQQSDALMHVKDKQKAKLKAGRESQKKVATRQPKNGKSNASQRQPEKQLDPLQRPQKQEKSKTQGQARREERTARTEQTDSKQRKTSKDIQREAFEQGRRLRNSRDERERGDDGGRERER